MKSNVLYYGDNLDKAVVDGLGHNQVTADLSMMASRRTGLGACPERANGRSRRVSTPRLNRWCDDGRRWAAMKFLHDERELTWLNNGTKAPSHWASRVRRAARLARAFCLRAAVIVSPPRPPPPCLKRNVYMLYVYFLGRICQTNLMCQVVAFIHNLECHSGIAFSYANAPT